jgi:transposase
MSTFSLHQEDNNQNEENIMASNKNTPVLSVVHGICCGLDVHKREISACVVETGSDGSTQSHLKQFGTFTHELVRLRDWLCDLDCPIVAMESTGVYWRPVHNVLEGYVQVVLVNARHVKNVPGRKTDIEDSRWLAGLLRHGLVRGSFIPPKEVRQWREMVRLRRKYVETLGDFKRRTQKLFECANIKIDSVVSDLFGLTGRNLMKLLISRETITIEEVKDCARGQLINKVEELYRSIQGFFEAHHRFLLESVLQTIENLEKQISSLEICIKQATADHDALVERLDEVPGIDQLAARVILAEVGPTLAAFANAEALCSWAGVCPGNNESAGKRHSGKSPVKKHPLKTILVDVAWAAIKKKGSYYQAKYYRLRARRGAKKAIIAIAHRILKAIYAIIKLGSRYRELGEHYLDRETQARKLAKLKIEARQLGYKLVVA